MKVYYLKLLGDTKTPMFKLVLDADYYKHKDIICSGTHGDYGPEMQIWDPWYYRLYKFLKRKWKKITKKLS